MMENVYIVAAKRTPVGSFLGALSAKTPGELGGLVIKKIIEASTVGPDCIDEVIVGNVLSAGQKQGVGRQCAIIGGVPAEVPAYSLDMLCGSGMKAIDLAYTRIRSGEASLVLAGGTEAMSQAGYILPGKIRSGQKMMDFTVSDHMVTDGLTDAFNNYHMGITAENIAEKYAISREEQDAFAFDSQQKAIAAVDAGTFNDEIIPVDIKVKRDIVSFNTDEYPNRKTTVDKLGTLKPVFKKDGTVTAGNASGINDGASMTLIASESAVKKYNLTPLVEIKALGQGGVDPSIMGMGPVPAIKNAFQKTDITLSDIDLIELNEAFAAQSLGVLKELENKSNVSREWFMERTNVNGGAIALGHPIGASGNRITTTLVHEMKKRKASYGLASLCVGGGMGVAIILKNI